MIASREYCFRSLGNTNKSIKSQLASLAFVPRTRLKDSFKRRSISTCSSSSSSSPTTLHCLRHGPTEMAAYMALHKYGSPHQEPLRDPMLYDTVLTSAGRKQVESLAAQINRLRPAPEVVLVSPLSRCLETATLAAGHLGVPLVAEPLLREKVTLSSEIGQAPGALKHKFPRVDFPADMEEVWWYSPTSSSSSSSSAAGGHLHVDKEPEDVYQARLAELRQRLASRPEHSILIVSHWGVLHALTGFDLAPAEIRSVDSWLVSAPGAARRR